MEDERMARNRGRREALAASANKGTISNAQGADALGISIRQFQRLRRRFELHGAKGLVHGNRGRPSSRKLPAATAARVQEMLHHPQVRINDCHLHDLLAAEGIPVSVASIRRLRRAEGLPAKHRRRPAQHRSRRERRPREGAMVLIDGSPFQWIGFELGIRDLVGTMDDATSKVLALTFRPNEDLHGYATVLGRTVRQYGVPEVFYGDRTSIAVRSDQHWSREEELEGRQFPPHFGQMLDELGVRYIPARSPEAKGRIERLWRTLQDRLATELCLERVRTWDKAEAFLEGFILRFNQRFSKPALESVPAWRPAPQRLDRILAARYVRTVGRDNTISIERRILQIPPGPANRSYHRCRIEVRELLDGRRLAFYQGKLIAEASAPMGAFTLEPRTGSRSKGASIQDARPKVIAASVEPVALSGLRKRTIPPSPTHPWKRHDSRRHPNLPPRKARAGG